MTDPQKKPRSLIVRLLKWFAILIILLVGIFVGVGQFVLDGKFDVSRETTIKASPESVHKLVGDLREWPKWLPFTKHDKTIKTDIVQPTGVGANQSWVGDTGKGKLTFTASDEAKGIEFDLVLHEVYPSKGSLTYKKTGDDTVVVWRMHGQSDGLIGHWLAFATPTLVGPMFDEGLADLKKEAEKK
jgi:Polyketide cyclase / dehydrase and lipid transport